MDKIFKHVLILAVIAAVFAFSVEICTASAVTYTPYTSNVSSTYLNIFSRILSRNENIGKDYVILQDGQYTYRCLIGDLDLSNNVFTGSDCKIYTLNTRGYQSGQSYYLTQSVMIDDVTVRNQNNYVLYSNLGVYAEADTNLQYSFFMKLLCLLIIIFGFFMFFNTLYLMWRCRR